MEATALDRGVTAQLVARARAALRSRSRPFWIVVGLTGLAAALRFSTLGLQSFHHDEIVTAGRVVRATLWHLFDKVETGESVPPLYYLLAWIWTHVAGTGAIGLRSLSAIAGVATVPVAFMIAAQLRGARAGIVAAALVATNPMLIWYSQEARCYALLVLLCAVSLLFFFRALNRRGDRDMLWWAVASALALGTHYFALFPVALEAALLWRSRRREAMPALGGVGLACLALAPLALTQASHIDNTDWIARLSLPYRLGEAGVAFMAGETGYLIAQPVRPLLALVPALIVVAALAMLLVRGEDADRRAGGLLLALSAATILVPLTLALIGKDFFLDRNLIGAVVPLLAAVAIATTLRRARRAGSILAAALVAYSLAFWVATGVSSSLQRPDYRGVAIRLGEPDAPRAMVTWMLGAGPLKHYLGTHAFQVDPEGERWFVHELYVISRGVTPPTLWSDARGFRRSGSFDVGSLRVTRYSTPGLRHLRVRTLKDAELGFRSNRVLLDGIGPEL